MNDPRSDSKERQARSKEILLGLLLIAIGSIAEYVDEVLLQGAFQPTTDPFPAHIYAWDTRIFLLINNGLANPHLGWLFSILTRLGSTLSILTISVMLYLCKRRREGILILASLVIGTLVTLPMKLAIARPRPYVTIPNTILFDREAGSSFPSGHAMRAFAFAFTASKLRPRFTVPLCLFAVLIGFSRVYVGQHYPLDVLTGTLTGVLVGYLTMMYENKILKAVSRLGFPIDSQASATSRHMR